MVRRRISEAQIWQIIGMHTTGMSFKAIGRQMGYHYNAVVSRLVRKHTQTDNVKDLPRSGRPRVTSDCDDRTLQRLVRRMPFATSSVLKQYWLPNRLLSTITVRNRLKSAGLKSKIVIKHPLSADRHRRTHLAWCLARRGWNLKTWRKIRWSDEGRFLLHVTDGRMRAWRHKTTAYTPRNIQPTVPYGGGSVMVWGCISHDCKLDLVTIQGNLTGDQYIRDVLQPVVVPHFDNHPLATRHVYMDDNARPHRSRAVTAYLQTEAVTSVPWRAMSPDLNPIEHSWDMLGRRIQARESPVQNSRQFEAALHRELQQLSQQDIRRLTGGMRRRVETLFQVRGGYTRY
jgi:transposase